MSEQLNRKCLTRNTILQLSTPYTDPIPSIFPPLAVKKKVKKGRDIYIPPLSLQGNPDQQRFTIEVAY